MNVSCIIPARMGSTRFNGKPLAKICGKPMILHTLERALAASCFSRIICATDSALIANVVKEAGFESYITGEAFTGSDRVAIAAKALGLDLVVNLQGDEPLVEPSLLTKVAHELQNHTDEWVTVATPLLKSEALNKNIVKVLVKGDYALDFSRSVAVEDAALWKKHQGVYAYSMACRDEFSHLPRKRLELELSLEQMRIMGIRPIRIVKSDFRSISVDAPIDVNTVEAELKKCGRGFEGRK